MLRRGYNFVDGSDALGGLDAGLFFIAYVRDPDTQFIPLQNADGAAGRADGVPQVHLVGDLRRAARRRPGEYVGQALFTDSSAVLSGES